MTFQTSINVNYTKKQNKSTFAMRKKVSFNYFLGKFKLESLILKNDFTQLFSEEKHKFHVLFEKFDRIPRKSGKYAFLVAEKNSKKSKKI